MAEISTEELEKLEKEYAELQAKIKELLGILSDEGF